MGKRQGEWLALLGMWQDAANSKTLLAAHGALTRPAPASVVLLLPHTLLIMDHQPYSTCTTSTPELQGEVPHHLHARRQPLQRVEQRDHLVALQHQAWTSVEHHKERKCFGQCGSAITSLRSSTRPERSGVGAAHPCRSGLVSNSRHSWPCTRLVALQHQACERGVCIKGWGGKDGWAAAQRDHLVLSIPGLSIGETGMGKQQDGSAFPAPYHPTAAIPLLQGGRLAAHRVDLVCRPGRLPPRCRSSPRRTGF